MRVCLLFPHNTCVRVCVRTRARGKSVLKVVGVGEKDETIQNKQCVPFWTCSWRFFLRFFPVGSGISGNVHSISVWNGSSASANPNVVAPLDNHVRDRNNVFFLLSLRVYLLYLFLLFLYVLFWEGLVHM